MNTIKFSKRNLKTTEQHNLEVSQVEEVNLFDKTVQMYFPCNLNIFITNECHNHCSFCINKDYSGTDIEDEEYYNALIAVFEELKDKPIEITLTGGEPSLKAERFVRTMELCKRYGFKCRTVSTTGLQLMKNYNGLPLCQYMLENGFVHNINVSRMHYLEDKNREVFQGSKNLTNKDLERLRLFFKLNNAELRLSCNLLSGYIDDLQKMLDFVDYYNKFDTVMFREVVGNSYIRLSDILDFKDFVHIDTLDGMYYTVEVYYYREYLVKYYMGKKVDTGIFSSLALRNGVLMQDFKKEIWSYDKSRAGTGN